MRQFVVNNVVLLIQYGVSAVVSLLLVPHIVREVGLTPFGTLALALSIATYAALTVQYAFHLTGPRHLMQPAPEDQAGDVVSRVTSAKLVLFGVVVGMALVAAGISRLAGPGPTVAQVVIVVALPLAALLNTGWHLQAAGRFVTVSAVSIVGVLVALSIGFTQVHRGNPVAVTIGAVALVTGPLLAGIGTLALSARLIADRGDGRLGWQAPWTMLSEGWPLFSSQMVAALYSASGPIVVSSFAGTGQAGAYGVVERVTNALIGGCLLTHTVAYPRLAGLYKSDRRAYLRLLSRVVMAYLAMASLIAVFVIVRWDSVTRFLFGQERLGHGALVAAAIVWLLLGSFGTALTGYFTVSGQSRRVLPLTFKILLVSIALGFPGTFFMGAWAWMAALCAAQSVNVIEVWRAWRLESRIVSRGASPRAEG